MRVDLKQLGMQALQNRRFSEAVAQLSLHLQASPQDYEAGTALALAYLKAGQPEEALRRFGKLATQYPYSSSVHFHHGLALEEVGKREEAIAAFELVLKLKPKHTSASSRLAALRAGPKPPPVPIKESVAQQPKFEPAPKTDPAPPIPLPLDEIEVLPDLDEIGLEEEPVAPAPAGSPVANPPRVPRPAPTPEPEPVLMAIPLEEPVAMAIPIEDGDDEEIVEGVLVASSPPPPRGRRR